MNSIFVHIPRNSSLLFNKLLLDKGMGCTGWSVMDSYYCIRNNGTYHSFNQIKGAKFVEFPRKHFASLQLVPKEAVTDFIVSTAND